MFNRPAVSHFLLGVALLFAMAGSACAEVAKELSPFGEGVIVEVIDGDTVALADGRQVRMVGIQAPKLPLGRKNFQTWPLAAEAKTALQTMVNDAPVTLRSGGAKGDRHGRVLAHIRRADGLWLQEEMLRAGMARVYSFADNRAALPKLYAAESAARAARKGIWAHPYYRIVPAKGLQAADIAAQSAFVLVEGQVLRVTHRGRATYIDFGADWRSDFSVRVLSKNRRNFGASEESGMLALDRLVAQHVRVRGWAYSRNGVMIDIDHPEAIEFLGASNNKN